MADYQYGINCIVAGVRKGNELDLTFVLNRKQYVVTFRESKDFDGGRNFSEILLTSDALKASAWNVISGPPGSDTRTWYVTDIWNPNITGMEKSRLPEPTFSIVCKIAYPLGKDFFVCEMGRNFAKDTLVIPRSLVYTVVKNTCPEIGDYLLVCVLVCWEVLDCDKVCRLVPLWAYWDRSNCSLASIAHLNIVERGPENSTLLVPDPIPCMWGVVQNVAKKSLKVYVPCIGSSVTVPKHAIFQHGSEMLEEDWLQLWLTPQNSKKIDYRFCEVSNWTCRSCCWFGRARKRYEAYLQWRLSEHYVKHSSPPVVGSEVTFVTTPAPAVATHMMSKTPPTESLQTTSDSVSEAAAIETGTGKVLVMKEKSGTLQCQRLGCKVEHVFHLGLMTVYGVKMAGIKGARLMELVEEGSELRYRMTPLTHHLRAVWIGPEDVTFEHLNFLPEMTNWASTRSINEAVVQEMLEYIMDNFEAVSKEKREAERGEALSVMPKEVRQGAGSVGCGDAEMRAIGASVVAGVVHRGSGDGQDDDGGGRRGEEEAEGWSDSDSDESVDELEPVLIGGHFLTDVEKVDKVQTRWKTARDAYFKSRNKSRGTKSGSAAAKATKYVYHDLLQFLDSIRECTTECSLELETKGIIEQDETLELPTNENPLDDADNFSSPSKHHKKDDFKRKRPQKGPSAFEDSLLSLLRDSREKEDDDDRAFFTSIIPLLKTFNQDQKLMFRTEVLQLMTRIKNVASLQPQFPQPPYVPSSSPKAPVQNLYLSNSFPLRNNEYIRNQATAPLPSPSTSTSSWETL